MIGCIVIQQVVLLRRTSLQKVASLAVELDMDETARIISSRDSCYEYGSQY